MHRSPEDCGWLSSMAYFCVFKKPTNDIRRYKLSDIFYFQGRDQWEGKRVKGCICWRYRFLTLRGSWRRSKIRKTTQIKLIIQQSIRWLVFRTAYKFYVNNKGESNQSSRFWFIYLPDIYTSVFIQIRMKNHSSEITRGNASRRIPILAQFFETLPI